MLESIQARTESEYLIISNKQKCIKLLSKGLSSDEDLIDFYISLHIVMEVSLNALFRNLTLLQIHKSISKLEIAENVDRISFINKTILFIYNYHYDFKGRVDEADKHHRVIKYLRIFAEPRNKLLHGHSISTLYSDDGESDSGAKKLLDNRKIQEQINLFRCIFEGLAFYVLHIDSSLTQSGKENLIKEFLNDDFLNV